MDRELSTKTKQAAKRKRIWQISIAVATIVFAVLGFQHLITPSINRATVRTATVEKGSVTASLTATGVVVPEKEQVITSPIQARIEQVVRTSGEQVDPGNQVLLLDRSYTQLAYDKLKDEQQLNQHKMYRCGFRKSSIALHRSWPLNK